MWELVFLHALQSATFKQSKQFLVQIWHKEPCVSLELGNLGCCTPSPEAALCHSLQFHRRHKSGAIRDLCEPTPQVSKPLPNVCCSSPRMKFALQASTWTGVFDINQTHKLCLKLLWCLTTSREEGWHLCRRVMRTLFCPWRGHRRAQRCCPAWGKGNRSTLAWPRHSNPMCQIHHQFPLWLPVDESLHVPFLKDAFKDTFLLSPSSRVSSLYLSTKHCHYIH